jgi:hypothetical protein
VRLNAGYFREEPGVGNRPARICEAKRMAQLLGRDQLARVRGSLRYLNNSAASSILNRRFLMVNVIQPAQVSDFRIRNCPNTNRPLWSGLASRKVSTAAFTLRVLVSSIQV